MIVLDTTVLVYATGADHTLRAPCRSLVAGVRGGAVDATTTIEVVQEFAHVRSRRRGRADGAELARTWVDLLSPLLTVTESALLDGLRLFGASDSLGSFDAVLAAAALEAGAEALVSADSAFGGVPGLRHVIPDTEGVSALLPAPS